MTDNAFYTRLNNRAQIKISGNDRFSFLQGLISNDLKLLKIQPCIYSCLLSPHGKFLYDFFITEKGDALILDCEGGERLTSLAKLLSIYKLRSDIQILSEDNINTYAIFGTEELGIFDPRNHMIGTRSNQLPTNLPEKPFNVWDEKRIRLTIPDGSRDMTPEKSMLLEYRIDKLHGVSFDKGCYVGQELIARTHFRGLIKSHLYTIEALFLPLPDTKIVLDGHVIGEMRSSSGNIGLAILKDEAISNFEKTGFKLLKD